MTSVQLPVDIIIPVYRNLPATRRCIESVLAAPKAPRNRLIVIDDCSPEPDLAAYCATLENRQDVVSLRNASNLGFVGSINRGIEIAGDNDVLLLNSDTEVANDWLQRMQDCAYRHPRTATVTPLSNNASVCSYPLPMEDNPLPPGWTTATLDMAAATANSGKSLELPTGVGFCLYIRRDCLQDIGAFDSENFGIGYGEECDFCMRARAVGRHNVLSADVFVYHQGGQSFTDQTRDRIQAAEATLHRLHPEYHPLATRFIDEDPLRPFRDALDGSRLEQKPEDAPGIIAALAAHRDTLLGSKRNREHAVEHALGELSEQAGKLQNSIAETEGQLAKLTIEIGERDAALEKMSSDLHQTTDQLQQTSVELKRLQSRDWRWKYAIYLINRLDALRLKFTRGTGV